MTSSNHQGLQFTPNWRASLLVLILLPVLLSLGFWQLERADEKRALQHLFEQRQAGGPQPIEQLWDVADLQYRNVSLRGTFINDKALLLDNRIYRRRFGYEIITPFQLADSGRIVLINRGWLPGDSARRSLPPIESFTGLLELQGEIYVPQSEMMKLENEKVIGWPRVVQSIDIRSIAEEFGSPLFPYTVRLAQDEPGSYQPNWVVVNIQPEKHTGYAVQWFAMSFTLLLISILANTNIWSLIKPKS